MSPEFLIKIGDFEPSKFFFNSLLSRIFLFKECSFNTSLSGLRLYKLRHLISMYKKVEVTPK